jgi:hypothetical protein
MSPMGTSITNLGVFKIPCLKDLGTNDLEYPVIQSVGITHEMQVSISLNQGYIISLASSEQIKSDVSQSDQFAQIRSCHFIKQCSNNNRS